MAHSWKITELTTISEIIELFISRAGNRWLYRGQSKRYDKLTPSIDRDDLHDLSRTTKLNLERKSIEQFRLNARYFTDEGEKLSMINDFVTLMVLRHYGIPTRFIDWSVSPWIACYFAVIHNDNKDAEIWTFNEPLYEEEGAKQWQRWPQTTIDNSGNRYKFDPSLTASLPNEPPDWFVCNFYSGFHRQNAQSGAYSFTARFDKDHANAIETLLKDNSHFNLFIISSNLKPKLREILKNEHGIWRGPLFPDSAGAAETVREVVFNQILKQRH